MGETLYSVADQRGQVLAKDMSLDNALLFIKALMEQYWQDDDIAYRLYWSLHGPHGVKNYPNPS